MVSFHSKSYFTFHKHHSIIPAYASSSSKLCEFLFTLPLFIYLHTGQALRLAVFISCAVRRLHQTSVLRVRHNQPNCTFKRKFISTDDDFLTYETISFQNLLNSVLEHTVTLQELTQRPSISTTLIASFTFENKKKKKFYIIRRKFYSFILN